MAMEGQCPVTLVEQSQWRQGDVRWGAVHRNRTYLFAGPEQQRTFLANPDQYSPVLSGFDPVRYIQQGDLVEGRREHGLMFRRIFLFADEESLQQFWQAPDYYAERVQRIMHEADQRNQR
jgi:YHS domain-containing protein